MTIISITGVVPHVVAVDDDPDIRDLLRGYLEDNEIRVSTLATGAGLSDVLDRDTIDLVVLDVRLPGENGMQIARRLREKSPTLPILMLTGRADEADRVMGLELGADDYITKPFSSRELLARIRALLRRSHAQTRVPDAIGRVRAYRFGQWELNVGLRRLSSPQGEPIGLTNGEFSLLTAFLSAPQRTLTRSQLLELTRLHDAEVYDRSIDIQILRLRRKIERDATRPEFIVTHRGSGYAFEAPVDVVR
ncbi:MAG: response regulator [Trichocoleus desertorum ATA4-8-CV12]|jgi:DNA-binding response OmpR family regulator|nr:response regulator [Trichocoleus desertorum ATA4-8-CV12]